MDKALSWAHQKWHYSLATQELQRVLFLCHRSGDPGLWVAACYCSTLFAGMKCVGCNSKNKLAVNTNLFLSTSSFLNVTRSFNNTVAKWQLEWWETNFTLLTWHIICFDGYLSGVMVRGDTKMLHVYPAVTWACLLGKEQLAAIKRFIVIVIPGIPCGCHLLGLTPWFYEHANFHLSLWTCFCDACWEFAASKAGKHRKTYTHPFLCQQDRETECLLVTNQE